MKYHEKLIDIDGYTALITYFFSESKRESKQCGQIWPVPAKLAGFGPWMAAITFANRPSRRQE